MYQVSLLPGNYLFWIDSADPLADPEDQLISGQLFTTLSTQAEQLESIALVCTTDLCEYETSAAAQLMLLGNGWQRDRCFFFGGAQEYVPYQMQTALISGPTWTRASDDLTPPLHFSVEDILNDGNVIGAVGSRPLHSSGMIISINGLRTPEHDEDYRWVLYKEADPPVPGFAWKSRLRLRMRMSYFDTTFTADGTTTDVAEAMPCATDLAIPVGTSF